MTPVAVALIWREGRLFLQRRTLDGGPMAGLWELPGGKLEPGESAAEALRRELLEELRWSPEGVEALAPLEHAYPDRPVRLHPFRCTGQGALHTALSWGWFGPAEARRLGLPAATRRLLDRDPG